MLKKINQIKTICYTIFSFDPIKKYGVSRKSIALDLGILILGYWLVFLLLRYLIHTVQLQWPVGMSSFLGILTAEIIRIILIFKKTKKGKETEEHSFHYPNDFIVK